jgi:hypothetical protein
VTVWRLVALELGADWPRGEHAEDEAAEDEAKAPAAQLRHRWWLAKRVDGEWVEVDRGPAR